MVPSVRKGPGGDHLKEPEATRGWKGESAQAVQSGTEDH